MIKSLSIYYKIPEDQIRVLLSLLFSFSFSLFFRLIKNPSFRLVYSIVPTIFIFMFLYGQQSIYILATHFICILLIYVIPRKYYGVTINSIVAITLGYIHYKRMMTDYGGWTMDISLAYMIYAQRWSAFSFNYSDWTKKEINYKVDSKNIDYSIESFNILNFLGYINFFPSSISGPFQEYRDYMDFINLKENYSNIIYSYTHVIKSLLLLFSILALYLLINPYLSVHYFFYKLDELNNLTNPEFLDYVVTYGSYLIIYIVKIRYYCAFLFSDICCIACGIAYDETKKNTDDMYTKSHSMNVFKCETTIMIKDFFRNWNIGTHIWLKRYCFKRVIKYTGKFYAEMFTFVLSGLWHGFYLSYHLIFFGIILGVMMQEMIIKTRKGYETSKLFFKFPIKVIFEVLYFISFSISYNFLIIMLDNLRHEDLIDVTIRLKFIPIGAFAFCFVLGFIGKKIFPIIKEKV